MGGWSLDTLHALPAAQYAVLVEMINEDARALTPPDDE